MNYEGNSVLNKLIQKYSPKVYKVLEIGCGDCENLINLKKNFKFEVTGIEPFFYNSKNDFYLIEDIQYYYKNILNILIDKIKIDITSKSLIYDKIYKTFKFEKIRIFNIYAEEIDLLKEKFDLIYSIRSFHHIKNYDAFFAGLKKTLSQNGVFILVDWKKGFNTGVIENYFSEKELIQISKKFNFEIIESGELNSVFYIVLKNNIKTNFKFTTITISKDQILIKENKKNNNNIANYYDDIKKKYSSKIKNNNNKSEYYNRIDLFLEEFNGLYNELYSLIEKNKIIFINDYYSLVDIFNISGIKVYLDKGNEINNLKFLEYLKKAKPCKWQTMCPVYYRYKDKKLSRFWVDNYCFINNNDCIRYQLEEKGISHSDNMIPDGRIFL